MVILPCSQAKLSVLPDDPLREFAKRQQERVPVVRVVLQTVPEVRSSCAQRLKMFRLRSDTCAVINGANSARSLERIPAENGAESMQMTPICECESGGPRFICEWICVDLGHVVRELDK